MEWAVDGNDIALREHIFQLLDAACLDSLGGVLALSTHEYGTRLGD